MGMRGVEAGKIDTTLSKTIILSQKVEVSKRNPTVQDRKTKRPYEILSCNLLTKIYRKNPRKDSRERAIENIRKKIAPISRTNKYQKE